MKKLFITLLMVSTMFGFSQTYELPKDNIIVLDSTLTSIVKSEYNIEKKWRDPSNLEFYDKRIKDVMKKYYWVVENEFEEANANNWFRQSFKYALDNSIARRTKFVDR